MLAFRADLQAIEETITRNIQISVVSDIKKLLGISHDVYTIYDEKDNTIKTKNSLGEVKGHNTFKEDIFNVDMEETTEEGHELTLVVYRPDFKPIYQDEDINAKITPIYLPRKLEFKIKYSNRSKSKLYSIANKLKLFTSTDGMYKLHDLEYHYVIPNFVLKLLMHFNNLKNLRYDDGDKLALENYIDKYFDNRVDVIHTLDANFNKSNVTIREAQVEAEGYIQDDTHGVQVEFDETFNMYYIEFTYGLTYEKPVSLLVEYPIMVFNNVIDKQFRTFIGTNEKNNPRAKPVKGRGDMVELTSRYNVIDSFNSTYYIRLPYYDDEVIPKPTMYITRVFSVLLRVDENDPTYLLNIKDELPKVKIKDDFLKFIIKSEYPYVGNEYESFIYLELFKDSKKDYKNKVIMEDSGVVRSNEILDIKSTYRLVFNIVSNLNKIHPKGRERFKDFVKSQLDVNENKSSISMKNHLDYWNTIPAEKFYPLFIRDNLITDYLTFFQYNTYDISNAVKNSKNFLDVPFRLTGGIEHMVAKTVMQHGIIAHPFLELK